MAWGDSRRDMEALDRHITGNYGEDQFKQRFKLVPKGLWAYAACDNPKCPRHPANGGQPNTIYPKYTDGENTYCDACVDESEIMG